MILLGEYLPRLNVVWPYLRGETESYADHLTAFFIILSSVSLSDNIRNSHALMGFDWRKVCFVPSTPSKFKEGNILIQNVRKFGHPSMPPLTPDLAWFEVKTTPFLLSSKPAGLLVVSPQTSLSFNWAWKEGGFAGASGNFKSHPC